jgi:hypothetical protein
MWQDGLLTQRVGKELPETLQTPQNLIERNNIWASLRILGVVTMRVVCHSFYPTPEVADSIS